MNMRTINVLLENFNSEIDRTKMIRETEVIGKKATEYPLNSYLGMEYAYVLHDCGTLSSCHQVEAYSYEYFNKLNRGVVVVAVVQQQMLLAVTSEYNVASSDIPPFADEEDSDE